MLGHMDNVTIISCKEILKIGAVNLYTVHNYIQLLFSSHVLNFFCFPNVIKERCKHNFTN